MIRSYVAPRPRTVAVAVTALLLALVAWQLSAIRGATPDAHAAVTGVTINMKVTGQHQGAFKGDDFATSKSGVGLITVTAFQLDLLSPRDASTGLATGHRTWKPIVVTHQVDGASPQFLTAASTNENLKSVVINFYRTDRTGRLVNFYRVTLTNASVTEVHQYTSGLNLLEDDSFVFQTIDVTEFTGHTTFHDTFSQAA